jgi:glycosyltransferase involved in cell wall biosynthesis
VSGKLRVGVDCRVLAGTGGDKGPSLECLLSELAEMSTGCEFYLFSNRNFPFPQGNPDFRRILDPGVRGLPETAWLFLVLPRLLRKHRIDVFLGFEHAIHPANRIPSVLNAGDLTYLRFPETMTPLGYWTNRILVPAGIRRCAAIVTVSAFTMKTVLAAFPFAAEKIRMVIHPAGTLKKTVPGDREEVLERLGVHEPFILAMGSSGPGKNLPALISAFACTENRDHQLVMAGASDWNTDTLDKLREEIPPEAFSRVRMLKNVSKSDMKRLYMQAGLFVLPSLFEGFSIPVVEAMECGTPVLSSRAASLPEVGGDAVACFDPEEQYDLLKKLDMLLRSPLERERIGSAGPARAALFSWRSAAEKLLQVLKDAAASEQPGV